MRAGLLAALVVCVATVAHADNKAWTAAKKTLAGGEQMVVVANFAAIRDSSLFQSVWPTFLKAHKDTADMLAKAKDTCGFDAVEQINSIVFATPSLDGNSDDAVFVINLKIPEKDVDACYAKLEKAQSGAAVKITTARGITTYDAAGTQLYMRWIDKNTLAFTAAGKDNLVKMAKGGLARDKALAAGITGIKSDAALAIIYAGSIPLDQVSAGAKANMVYGSATVAGGDLGAEVHLVVDNAKTAGDLAGKINDELAKAKASGSIPPMVAGIVQSLAVKASGSELVVTASAPEKDMLTLVNLAMAGATP